MDEWRSRILSATLWVTFALASVAYVPGVWAAYQGDMVFLIVANTIGWLVIFVLALWRALAFAWRAFLFLAFWALFSITLLGLLGPVGAGALWLVGLPILAALFFDYKGAIGGMAVLLAVFVTYGVTLNNLPGGETRYTLVSWLGTSGSLIFISGLLSLAIAELLHRLLTSMTKLQTANQQLASVLREQELLEQKMLQSEKHAALGELARGIAHDFNNLLVPVKLSAEQARALVACDSEQAKHLDSIVQTAERARHLIRRILTYGRATEREVRVVAVEALVREVGELVRSAASSDVRIEYVATAPGLSILADVNELHQILMNLGTNACQAMPAGGTLTWRLYTGHADGVDHVCLDVTDTGVGIEPQDLPKLFEPSFSKRVEGEGNGLGLAIVYRLVTGMAGTIDVTSEPSQGTCFTLCWPSAQTAADVQSLPSISPAREATPLRIMIVDDQSSIRELLARSLKHRGHEVAEAATAAACLEVLKQRTFDVLISDLNLPGISGLEIIRRSRELHPAIRTVLMSGDLRADQDRAFHEAGVDCALQKPFSMSQLIAALDRMGR